MDLHNPLEGEPRAWQSHESVSDFLQRLPPSTTAQATIGPWIFVANPHRHGQDRAGRSRIRELEKKGADLLEQSLQKRAEIGAQTGKTSAAIRRELNQESKLLKDRIEQLAEETNVLSGKVRAGYGSYSFIDAYCLRSGCSFLLRLTLIACGEASPKPLSIIGWEHELKSQRMAAHPVVD